MSYGPIPDTLRIMALNEYTAIHSFDRRSRELLLNNMQSSNAECCYFKIIDHTKEHVLKWDSRTDDETRSFITEWKLKIIENLCTYGLTKGIFNQILKVTVAATTYSFNPDVLSVVQLLRLPFNNLSVSGEFAIPHTFPGLYTNTTTLVLPARDQHGRATLFKVTGRRGEIFLDAYIKWCASYVQTLSTFQESFMQAHITDSNVEQYWKGIYGINMPQYDEKIDVERIKIA